MTNPNFPRVEIDRSAFRGGRRDHELSDGVELLVQRSGQPLHLVVERLVIVLDRLRADVPAGRQNVPMFGDFRGLGRPAEAGHVLVLVLLPAAQDAIQRVADRGERV